MLPRSRQRRQHGNRPHCLAAILRPLHSVVHPQRRWPRRSVLARQPFNLPCRHPRPRGHPLRRVLLHPLRQSLKPMRPFRNECPILQPLVQDHLHHPQRQRPICPRPDCNVPVRQRRCPRPVRVDHNQPPARPPRLLNHRPQVHVVPMDVRAPRQHQLRQAVVLWRRSQLLPINQLPGLSARLAANRSVQLARPQPVKEPPVHRPKSKLPDRPRIAVRQNRLRPKLLRHSLQPRGNRVQRLVPTHPLKRLLFFAALQRPLGHSRFAPQRIQQPIRRIHPVQILRHLAAQKPLRHRMFRVPLHLHRPALRVHSHQHAARVRAVVRTHRVHHFQR